MSQYFSEPSWSFQNCCESASDNVWTPQDTPRTSRKKNLSFRNLSESLGMNKSTPENLKTSQNIKTCLRTLCWSELMSMPQNASEYSRAPLSSRKAFEPSGTFMNCWKHIGQRMPQKLSGTFQNNSEPTITPRITSKHPRTSDNLSEHSQTFLNHWKPIKHLRLRNYINITS